MNRRKNKHQKPNVEMAKLGHFRLREVVSLFKKRPSLFDVRFSMYLLGTVHCQQIHQRRIRR